VFCVGKEFEESHLQARVKGGLQLILGNCGYDDNNPYLREWSVLALKNLCDQNEENQQYVRDLNPVKVKNNESLEFILDGTLTCFLF
jgi:ataxin-10